MEERVPRSFEYKFMQQQGFIESDEHRAKTHFRALLWQPRIVGSAILVGIILQNAWIFLAISAVLWINTLLPRLNPFERLYDATLGKKRYEGKLPPAPAPRRFMQGMAATINLIVVLAILGNQMAVAYIFQIFLVVGFGLLLFGKFCLGAYLYHLFKGNKKFARQTSPWSP